MARKRLSATSPNFVDGHRVNLEAEGIGEIGDHDANEHCRQEARQQHALFKQEPVDRVAESDAHRQHEDRRQDAEQLTRTAVVRVLAVLVC